VKAPLARAFTPGVVSDVHTNRRGSWVASGLSPYVRKVPDRVGGQGCAVIWSKKHGRAEVEHIGSAHHEAEMDRLTAVARQRIHAGQEELDLGGPTSHARHRHPGPELYRFSNHPGWAWRIANVMDGRRVDTERPSGGEARGLYVGPDGS
jgi:hypothetical protein